MGAEEALRAVRDPLLKRDVVSLGYVRGLTASGRRGRLPTGRLDAIGAGENLFEAVRGQALGQRVGLGGDRVHRPEPAAAAREDDNREPTREPAKPTHGLHQSPPARQRQDRRIASRTRDLNARIEA